MPKAKISVTVEAALLRDCERLARGASRSEVVQRALAGWLRDHRKKGLEEATERYYASLTAEDRREDREWAGLGGRVLGESWK